MEGVSLKLSNPTNLRYRGETRDGLSETHNKTSAWKPRPPPRIKNIMAAQKHENRTLVITLEINSLTQATAGIRDWGRWSSEPRHGRNPKQLSKACMHPSRNLNHSILHFAKTALEKRTQASNCMKFRVYSCGRKVARLKKLKYRLLELLGLGSGPGSLVVVQSNSKGFEISMLNLPEKWMSSNRFDRIASNYNGPEGL